MAPIRRSTFTAPGSVTTPNPVRPPRMLAAATLAAVLFCSLPFWTGSWLGMIDYPNHLARYFVVAHYAQLPALHEFYRVEWHFIPNIGLDLAVQAVHAATSLPTERVSQALVGALSVSLIPAVLLLNRALFGAWSYWPLASALPVYNNALLYGFTNYIGGLTLAVFLAAAWAAFRARPLVLVLPTFALGATTLFFFHLYALAVYGLFWLCHEACSLWMSRGARGAVFARQAAAALQFLPPLLVLALLSPTSGTIGLGHIQPSTVQDKLVGLFSVFDVGVPFVSTATLLAVGAVALAGLATRKLVFSPPGAVSVAAMAAAFLALPFGLVGSGFADYRLPVATAAVAIAASRWRGLPRRAALALSAALVALVAVRVAAMTSAWAQGNRRYAEIQRTMMVMEPGRKLLTVIAAEDLSARFLRRPPLDHASAFAVIARQSFVPTLFAEPEKQPISFAPAVAPLAQILLPIAPLYGPRDPLTPDALPLGHRLVPEAWLNGSPDPLAADAVVPYDYVMVLARTPLRRKLPAHLERIDDGAAADVAILAVRQRAGPIQEPPR